MKLSIIILNYNVSRFLELCLTSVIEATKVIDAEIIVVDNNSVDDSCMVVKQNFSEVILIENDQNYGFSKGNNIGVAHAKGEYLCVLNPDTVVAEDTFIKLLDFAKETQDMGIVGCKLVDGRGSFLPESKRNVPTPLVSIKKVFGSTKKYYASHLYENQLGETAILVGAFMILKRSIYDQVKGFDEDYFMYGDDMDLSYKVLKAGYKNYYNPNTTIIHYKGESTLKDKVYAKRFNGAMQIFFKKHFKPNLVFNVLIWIGIKVMSLLSPKQKTKKVKVDSYVFVSNKENEQLVEKLNQDCFLQNSELDLKGGQEVIFDNNVMSFKEIISKMITLQNIPSLTFKILPKNTNFIIGSNSSKSRGEVIEF